MQNLVWKPQLKETCEATGTAWAALLSHDGAAFNILSSCGLARNRLTVLKQYLQQAEVATWLAGTLQKRRPRWRKIGEAALDLPGQHIYVFPVQAGSLLYLVGAEALTSQSLGFWKVLANACTDLAATAITETRQVMEPAVYAGGDGSSGNIEMVYQLAQSVLRSNDPVHICRRTVEIVASHFEKSLVQILLVDEDGSQVRFTGTGKQVPAEIRFNPRGNEASQSSDTQPTPNGGKPIQLWLRNGEENLGQLLITGQDEHPFPPGDLLLADLVVDVLVTALINARSNQELKQTRVVFQSSLDLLASLERDELLQRIVRHAKEMVHARGADFSLINSAGNSIVTLACDNPWEGYDYTGNSHPVMDGITGEVVRTRSAITLTDYNQWPQRIDKTEVYPFSAIAALPIWKESEIIGVLTVIDDEPGRLFTHEDVALLEQLAPQVSIALQNSLLYRELQTRMDALKAAELRLVRSAKLAAVGDMAAEVAHELNNPLTSVSGFLELALDGMNEETAYRADLETALQETNRARNVVRRLLEFARPTDPVFVMSDINRLIRDSLALFGSLFQMNNIMVVESYAPGLSWISVDPGQMKQVFLNLLHISVANMPEGGRIEVFTSLQQQAALDWVVVDLVDQGKSMSTDIKERLFEPLFTADHRTGGSLFGLSAAYAIVLDHGGEIEIENASSQGNKIRVWLPVRGGEQ